MISDFVEPSHWLTEAGLTAAGREARAAYTAFCRYLEDLGLPSHQVARAKYMLAKQNYWTLPEGWSLPPHTVNLCVNNLCNLRCRYCDFGQGHAETFYHRYNVVEPGKRIEMTMAEMTALVDAAAWFRPIVRASFREPLLHPQILDLIAHVKKRGLPFWLLTNGFLLPKLADDLVRLGTDAVRLSLDGPPAVHDQVRGVKHAYQRMMEGVHRLLAAKRARGARLEVGFYFTLNDANYRSLLDTVRALDGEGILKEVFVNFQWLLYTSRRMAEEHNREDGPFCGGYVEESTLQSVDIGQIDLAEVHAQYQAIRREYPAEAGYRLHFRPSFELADLVRYRDSEEFPVPEPRCRIPWYNLNVNPAGEVKCFHHCLLPPVGNAFATPLMDLWNGPELRGQRMKLKERGAYRGCARCWGVYSLLEDTRRRD